MKLNKHSLNILFIVLFIIFASLSFAYANSGYRSVEEKMYNRSFVTDKKNELILRSTCYINPQNKVFEEKSFVTEPASNITNRSGLFSELIEFSGRKHKVETDLIKAIIQVESGGDPLAVSSAGAAGLMQLMPITAKELGVTDRFDPEQNIESGTRYLRGLMDRFGSTELALWAYNAGPTAVEEGRMPLETQEYVPRVLLMQNYFSKEVR